MTTYITFNTVFDATTISHRGSTQGVCTRSTTVFTTSDVFTQTSTLVQETVKTTELTKPYLTTLSPINPSSTSTLYVTTKQPTNRVQGKTMGSLQPYY